MNTWNNFECNTNCMIDLHYLNKNVIVPVSVNSLMKNRYRLPIHLIKWFFRIALVQVLKMSLPSHSGLYHIIRNMSYPDYTNACHVVIMSCISCKSSTSIANSYIYSHCVDRLCGIQPVNAICTEPYTPLSYKAITPQCSVGIHIYSYPITMATDSISGGNKSHARRVISTGSCGFQL